MIAVISLLVAMLSIQFGASLAKSLFPIVGPEGTTALRIVLAAIILCLVWRPWRRKFSSHEIRYVIFYGSSLGLMNLTFYIALQRIPLGIAVALEFVGPLSVALFASRKKMDFLWAALAIVGIILILPLQETSTHLDLIGVTFALIAGLFWGLYIIFGQKIGAALPGGVAVSTGMLVAAVVTLPFGVATEGASLFQVQVLPVALTVALFSSAIPYALEMIALKKMARKTFGIFMSIEPALAALSGFLILSEKLTLLQLVAIACVITASAGSSYSSLLRRDFKSFAVDQ
jgi:inner membrane transporter RhtA